MSNKSRANGSKRRTGSGGRPDPRETHSFLAEDIPAGGPVRFSHKAGALLTLAAQIELDGQIVSAPAPQFVAMYLIEAKGHFDKGERLRLTVIRGLHVDANGDRRLSDTRGALDCFASLVNAVLLAFAAIEALANAIIESLPANTTLPSVNRRGEAVDLDRDAMVRRLSTGDKLDRAVPLFTGEPSIKGTELWQRFKHLATLRNDLVHVKGLGYSGNPAEPTAYGRLLRGEGTGALDDAIALVEKLHPAWLSGAARVALGLAAAPDSSKPDPTR